MQVGISLTGVQAIDQRLASLDDSLRRKGVRVATRASAKLVAEDARRLAPEREGTLAASITVRSKERGSRAQRGEIGHAVVTKEGMFRGETFYGGFLEFGTAPRTTAAGANRGRIDDTQFAFLRPALYGAKPRVLYEFRASLLRWINSQSRGYQLGAAVRGGAE